MSSPTTKLGVEAASDVEPIPVEREACIRGEAAPSPPPRRAVCLGCLVSC
jgi:hypothetical protein